MPPDPYPPPSWPEGTVPTIAELRTWIRAHGPTHDPRVAADMIVTALEFDRDTLEVTRSDLRVVREALERMERRADRYRVAWSAARRRAATWKRIAGHIAERPR
jgi:hypothetical protein